MEYPDPSKFSKAEQDRLLSYLKNLRAENTPRTWYGLASTKQLPPDNPRHHLPWTNPKTGFVYACSEKNPNCTGPSPDWQVWLYCGGRGVGKTWAGAHWAIEMALSAPKTDVGVCSPNFAQLQRVCFNGNSGIIQQAEPGDIESYNKNDVIIYMRNGSRILGFSAENPDSVLGSNLTYAWLDELTSFQNDEFYTRGLLPALRIPRADGGPPRMMVTTTPRKMSLFTGLMKNVAKDPGKYHVTYAISWENPQLSDDAIERMRGQFGHNTALWKQEMEAELIDDEFALFKQGDFDKYRVSEDECPREFRQVVIGVDPATTSKEDSDDTGIVVIGESGEGVNHHSYILEDCSFKGSPERVVSRIEAAFYKWEADIVIVESNKAGDYFRTLMANKNSFIPVRDVHAAKGKKIRAVPISHLNEIGRMHMVGNGENTRLLEEQMCRMDSDTDRDKVGDDRADACLGRGSLVLTSDGEIPIENIIPGHLVWTRKGWRPVTAARCTQRNAEVMTIVLSDGRELTGTPDHKIWVENKGWVALDALALGDTSASPRPAHLSVVGSYVNSERRDVYDLTVADVHEFIANGVVVHNCIWAMYYLAGRPSVDWEKVYGFGTCKTCGGNINFLTEKTCGGCGQPVAPDKQEALAIGSGEKSATRWWNAYVNKCPKGHENYPKKFISCPKCKTSPDEYLRQAMALSGAGQGAQGYSGKDWLSGRRFL